LDWFFYVCFASFCIKCILSPLTFPCRSCYVLLYLRSSSVLLCHVMLYSALHNCNLFCLMLSSPLHLRSPLFCSLSSLLIYSILPSSIFAEAVVFSFLLLTLLHDTYSWSLLSSQFLFYFLYDVAVSLFSMIRSSQFKPIVTVHVDFLFNSSCLFINVLLSSSNWLSLILILILMQISSVGWSFYSSFISFQFLHSMMYRMPAERPNLFNLTCFI
jgi:hypothetical protein